MPTRGAPLTDLRTVELELAGIFPDLAAAVHGQLDGPRDAARRRSWPRERGWVAPAMPDTAARPAGPAGEEVTDDGTMTEPTTRTRSPRCSPRAGRARAPGTSTSTSSSRATPRCGTRSAGHPDQLIELVKASGLRGRGGAGFPTGMKWGFIPQGPTGPGAKPKYLVVNADEGEPGTCKDIPTMMADPHSLIEGCIITSYAIRAKFCAIYIRGEALHPLRRVRYAVEQAYAKGYLGRDILGSGFDLDIVVHAGAGAYICGEETALLDSLEGRRGQPRLKPPFPATAGLYASPTVVNNVETIASVPAIVQGGSSWFRTMGREKSPGPKIYSLSGHVDPARPVRGPDGHHAPGAARAGGRHEGRHPAQVLDAGRVVDADVHRRAPRRPARLRGRRGRRVDARHHGRPDVQRDRLGAVGGHEVDRVLQARELRQVHPVPGGHVLAAADPRADAARAGHAGGRRDAARRLRQHPRPLVLRPR